MGSEERIELYEEGESVCLIDVPDIEEQQPKTKVKKEPNVRANFQESIKVKSEPSTSKNQKKKYNKIIDDSSTESEDSTKAEEVKARATVKKPPGKRGYPVKSKAATKVSSQQPAGFTFVRVNSILNKKVSEKEETRMIESDSDEEEPPKRKNVKRKTQVQKVCEIIDLS